MKVNSLYRRQRPEDAEGSIKSLLHVDDGYGDALYDTIDFIPDEEQRLAYTEMQEHIAKEEVAIREYQEKLSKADRGDEIRQAIREHPHYLLVKDLHESKQRAMLGFKPKPHEGMRLTLGLFLTCFY